jgi:hypothetical protein
VRGFGVAWISNSLRNARQGNLPCRLPEALTRPAIPEQLARLGNDRGPVIVSD